MCQCTPEMRTPWCGRPGCEGPEHVRHSSSPTTRLGVLEGLEAMVAGQELVSAALLEREMIIFQLKRENAALAEELSEAFRTHAIIGGRLQIAMSAIGAIRDVTGHTWKGVQRAFTALSIIDGLALDATRATAWHER